MPNATVKLVGLEPAVLLTLIKRQLRTERDEEMIELLITSHQKIMLGLYQEVVKEER